MTDPRPCGHSSAMHALSDKIGRPCSRCQEAIRRQVLQEQVEFRAQQSPGPVEPLDYDLVAKYSQPAYSYADETFETYMRAY